MMRQQYISPMAKIIRIELKDKVFAGSEITTTMTISGSSSHDGGEDAKRNTIWQDDEVSVLNPWSRWDDKSHSLWDD